MANPARRPPADLEDRVVSNVRQFSFVQIVRLLHFLMTKRQEKDGTSFDLRDRMRIRPDLSLNFPGTDVVEIARDEDDPWRFQVTTSFLGLYGSSSPLPTFYTEDLMDEHHEGLSVTRDFLDIVNSPLYPAFIKIWEKYRLFVQVEENIDPDVVSRLFALLGYENIQFRRHLNQPRRSLRYLGLATQFPRSAEGLRSYIADAFQEPTTAIQQCIGRQVEIPEEQRCRLGQKNHQLGTDAYLDRFITDYNGKLRISLGPLDSDRFHRYLPDKPQFSLLNHIIKLYLDQPLIWDLEIRLSEGEIRPVRLGDTFWSQLGWNTWLFSSGQIMGEVVVRIWVPPERLADLNRMDASSQAVPAGHPDQAATVRFIES